MTPGQLQTALTDAVHLARQVDLRRCEEEASSQLVQAMVPAPRHAAVCFSELTGRDIFEELRIEDRTDRRRNRMSWPPHAERRPPRPQGSAAP
ncbi:hypothetical protein [Corallococcus macrosporus]|uniref:hypothetical protein n=1 Tax=Corallococcus macrosporus TaxID=35 RepID=UPI000BB38E16|nr:hypothetical protein [Corallococcus macrosporus]